MKTILHHSLRPARAAAAAALLVAVAPAQLPSYEVRVVAPYSTTTVVRGTDQQDLLVGYQITTLGQIVPFGADQARGLFLLPLPPGYQSGFANDANSAGVLVGAVAQGGFPFDGGEPAIWLPDGLGGYTVVVPQQFASLPSPLGQLTIQGGMAVAINDNGTIVGWSRYRGFQGGPTTRFSITGAPVDLGALGFQATVTDLADHVDVIVGGSLRMYLTTGVVTDLGLPPPASGSFSGVLGYSINDNLQTVAAARLATSLPDRWLTYRHTDAAGWQPLNPAVVPSPLVGFYDNNNRGDVSASGGVWFDAEGVLVGGFDALLAPTSSFWDTNLGFLADDRRVFTTGIDTRTGQAALLILEPSTCQTDLGFQGPGAASATLCGQGLALGQASEYAVVGAPSAAFGVLSLSDAGLPNAPLLGGTAVSFNGAFALLVTTDPAGGLRLAVPGSPLQVDLVFQSAFFDAALPQQFAFTNALLARFGR
ncbi:MAG: hypothetical protein AB7O97_23835 [Planctomycetota bacterium]